MFIVNVWETSKGGFVDKLSFDTRAEAERATQAMRAEDAADGFPEIYTYEILDIDTDNLYEANAE